MLRIGDTIFSLDVIEKKFRCNLASCLGNCCRYGDSGAPLLREEADMLGKIWPVVRNYLRPEGVEAIMQKGTSERDFENDLVTPLIGNEECAYTIVDGSIFKCGIEKAWEEGRVDFRKPLSCHLFPVRIKRYRDFTAVNYQELSICSAAREFGEAEGVYVYTFLKEPLVRALGEELYNELCIAATELKKRNGS